MRDRRKRSASYKVQWHIIYFENNRRESSRDTEDSRKDGLVYSSVIKVKIYLTNIFRAIEKSGLESHIKIP